MRQTYQKANRSSRTGSVLVIVALSLVALCGLAALAIDLGLIYEAKQRAQNAADVAALDAGRFLNGHVDNTGHNAAADQAASQNSAANAAIGSGFVLTGTAYPAAVTRDDGTTVTVGAGGGVIVQGYVNAPLSFAPVVGFRPQSVNGVSNTLSVRAQASVVLQNICTAPLSSAVAPFGVIGDDPNNADPTIRYIATLLSTNPSPQTPQPSTYQSLSNQKTLKINVWDNTGKLLLTGNFDPLQTSATSTYLNTIRNVTDQALTVGKVYSTLTGNQILQTQQGITARLSPSNAEFTHNFTINQGNQSGSAYDNWFFGNPLAPIDTTLAPVIDTGKTHYYHQEAHRQETTDAHILLVPVISQSVKNAPGTATILAFAAFFIEQPFTNSSQNLIVQGRFIGLAGLNGSGDACTGAGDQTARLIQ